MDGANKQVSYSVIDGEIASFCKTFTTAMKVEASGGGGSLVKWCMEYEKVNEEIPEPDIINECRGHLLWLGCLTHQELRVRNT